LAITALKSSLSNGFISVGDFKLKFSKRNFDFEITEI
jgi:hypothetical protein